MATIKATKEEVIRVELELTRWERGALMVLLNNTYTGIGVAERALANELLQALRDTCDKVGE